MAQAKSQSAPNLPARNDADTGRAKNLYCSPPNYYVTKFTNQHYNLQGYFPKLGAWNLHAGKYYFGLSL